VKQHTNSKVIASLSEYRSYNMRVWQTILPTFSAVVVVSCLCIPMVSANMAMLISLRKRLSILLNGNEINDYQYGRIVNDFANDEVLDAEMKDHDDHTTRPPLNQGKMVEFSHWLDEEVEAFQLAVATAELISNLFNLSTSLGAATDDTLSLIQNNAPASANYSNNGVVQFLARSNFSPPGRGELYNGIWGYQTGSREYALQCNSVGLNILDVTTNSIVKLQTIPMTGGTIWRDVATHSNYAYVASQGGNGDAWVINLSELSSSGPQDADSNPISSDNIQIIGNSNVNWGHTLNVWNGLLFLNGACGFGKCGCKIFDLTDDPMDPKYLTTYTKGDCHDSYVQTIQNKNIFITSDGYSRKWRLYDITDILNPNFEFTLLGQTPVINSNIYAHESVVSDDGKTLYAFDEFNKFDIAAFDISNLSDPQLIRTFQWSEEGQNMHPNTIVHNGFTRGNYLIVGYYEAGLRVFDISDISNSISEVGKYETYRDPDGNGIIDNPITGGYNGAWNVYVGLPSGKVLISDTVHGTFVVSIDDGNNSPTASPVTKSPTVSPVDLPTESPVKNPTPYPSKAPSMAPSSLSPVQNPTPYPSKAPASLSPVMAPTSLPTLSPNSVSCSDFCYENKATTFLLKVKNKEPVYESCEELAKMKNTNKKGRICRKDRKSRNGYGPASVHCRVTCSEWTTTECSLSRVEVN